MIPDDLAAAGMFVRPNGIAVDSGGFVVFCFGTLAENVAAARAFLVRREELRQAEAERRAAEAGKKPKRRHPVPAGAVEPVQHSFLEAV